MGDSRTAKQIYATLTTKYKGDPEAVEIIESAKADIEYIEAQERSGNYKGQTSIGKALELEAHLHDWF